MRIGLTGGIGSGKSTVAQMLVAEGCVLVDTDAIARSIAQPNGAAMAAIESTFGRTMIGLNGGLDRIRMRDLVFADASAKQQLEAILHPLIGMEAQRQAAAAGSNPILFDVPLLVESGRWNALVDRILVVDAAEETQVQRVVARSGWTADAVRAVIAQQATRCARRAAADAVIFNERLSLQQLDEHVRSLSERWKLAAKR